MWTRFQMAARWCNARYRRGARGGWPSALRGISGLMRAQYKTKALASTSCENTESGTRRRQSVSSTTAMASGRLSVSTGIAAAARPATPRGPRRTGRSSAVSHLVAPRRRCRVVLRLPVEAPGRLYDGLRTKVAVNALVSYGSSKTDGIRTCIPHSGSPQRDRLLYGRRFSCTSVQKRGRPARGRDVARRYAAHPT